MLKSTTELSKAEQLLDKYMQLPPIAREYIRLCTRSGTQREEIIKELFKDFQDFYERES